MISDIELSNIKRIGLTLSIEVREGKLLNPTEENSPGIWYREAGKELSERNYFVASSSSTKCILISLRISD